MLLLASSAALGCAARELPAQTSEIRSAKLEVARAAKPELTATPRGDTRLTWAPALLGAKPPVVRIEVANAGDASLDVREFVARLEATRDGATFECAEEEPIGRDATTVAPGKKVTFHRTFECALPLPGTYDARIVATFGSGPRRAEHRVPSAFELDVVTPDAYAPRPLAGVDGALVAIGTGRLLAASSAEGSATLAMLIVNASSREVKLPSLRVALSVEREGQRASCREDAVALEAPHALAPGHSTVATVDVECIGLGAAGRYELSARVFAGDRTTRVGPLRVDVTRNPLLIDPERSRRHDPTGRPSQ